MRLLLVLALALSLAPRPAAACEVPPSPQFFEIVHQVLGTIGQREARFHCADGTLVVEIEETIEVSLAVVTAFERTASYRQRWQQDHLLAFTSEIASSEGASWVRARRLDDRVRIETAEGDVDMPPSVVPDQPWKQALATRPLAFDADTGEILHLRGSTQGFEPLDYAGRRVRAQKITVRGDRERDLWFDEVGLLKSRFSTRGARITIHRRPYTPR